MSNGRQNRLPAGLPACLSSRSDGFVKLCELIEVNSRNDKHRLAKDKNVKRFLRDRYPRANRDLKTSARLQQDITEFYCSPKVRRLVWQSIHRITSGFKDPMPSGVPSLEYLALRKYDQKLLTAVIDQDELSECGAVFEAKPEHPDWQTPALAALPSIRADLINWHTLEQERQRQVLLAAFSVATLLDDVRLLRWASAEFKEIAEELSFAAAKQEKPVEAVQEGSGETTYSASGRTKATAENVGSTLQEACESLSNAALELCGTPPSAALFDAIASRADDIARLRETVLEAAAANDADNLIAGFGDFLRSQAEQTPWLAAEADSIEASWRKAYLSDGGNQMSELRSDIERGERDTKTHLQEWTEAAAEVAKTRDLLRACQDELATANDVAAHLMASEREEHYLQAAASLKSREREAMRGVLAAASPCGSEYAVHQDSTIQTRREVESGVVDDALETVAAPDSAKKEKTGAPSTESKDTQPVEDADDIEPAAAPTDSHLESDEADVTKALPDKQPVLVRTVDPTNVEPDIEVSPAPNENEVAVWNAVREDRIGLAYQIARLRPTVESSGVMHPASELLATVALGGSVCGPEGELAQDFAKYAEAVLASPTFEDAGPETRDALNLMLFSASVRPALFAPQSGAISMLQRVELSSELTPVYQLKEAIAGYTQYFQGIHFDLLRLNSILDATVWEDRLEKHAEQVKGWRNAAGSEQFLFKPSEMVWKYWLHKGGILFELTSLILGHSKASAPRVREIVDVLSDNKKFAHLVHDTHRNKLGLKRGGKISGRALAQLDGDAKKSVALARKWLRIIESKPGSEGFIEGKVAHLRNDIDKYAPKALAAIASVQKKSPCAALSAALAWTHESIDSLSRIFGHDRESPHVEGQLESYGHLTRDLLYVPELDIGPDGGIDGETPPADAMALLVDSNLHMNSLAEAFNARLARGDIAGAQTICEQMAREDDPDEDECQNKLGRKISAKRRELDRELDDLSEKLEQAYPMGEVSENERDALNASIVSARDLLSRKRTVVTSARTITGFKGTIEGYFNRGIERVRAQIEPFLPLKNDWEQEFVENALESGDLITLHEQVDRLNNGESLLPKKRIEHDHLGKLLSMVAKVYENLDGNAVLQPNALIRAVSKRENVLGLNFSSLSASEAERSTNLLKFWYEMTRGRTVDAGKIHGFLECLGFTVKACKPHGDHFVTASVKPLQSKELCPVSAFGSDANGRYEIVLNWRSPPEAPIVQSVSDNRSRCVIVFHFGRLSNEAREWLRGWSIRNRTPFITVDESLVLYLSSLQSGTLRAFFDCTLPFTAVQPFFTAAGLVPPESFYGRENERQEVMERWGSCFVYGGRQLGKTALLRSAEATFHRPESRQVAKCVDLKVHDVGIAHGAAHIWKTIWDILQELDVIESGQPVPRGRDKRVETVTNAVSKWVSDGEDTRILLLLDEADAFLAADLKEDFRESTRLKGLMDETRRKFKVVFSGLHNVLRTTERANHPLAHFGKPICVGPLLSNGELGEARALLREPLAAAGGEFETDNLFTHILVWTNYYPSLIQLYGAELVQYLRDTAGRSFPYSVDMGDIKAVFAKDGLRDFIRQRFSLTLQLDPRYEVIAYALALRFQGAGAALSQGLRPIDILILARDWWPDGFEISEKEFETLLQEMCGLGVLRKHRTEGKRPHYTFRNPNVLLLLGDSNEIEHVLYKEREEPEVFEASAFHAQYPDDKKPQSPRRGPLSYEQESLLIRKGGVAVISGTEAANVRCIGEFLDQRVDRGTFRNLKLCTDEAGLESQLTPLRPGAGGVHVYLVPYEAAWNVRWIERVAATLKRLKRGQHMRVVFLAEPQQLWGFVSELPDEYLDDENGLFEWFGIQPWNHAFLHRWCSDHNLQVGTSQVSNLLDVSGGWPCVLERYAESPEKSWQAKKMGIRKHIAENQTNLLGLLGLGLKQTQKDIFALHDYTAFTPDDARETARMMAEDQGSSADGSALVRRLWWAKQLGLVQDTQGTWALNSLLKKILPKSSP